MGNPTIRGPRLLDRHTTELRDADPGIEVIPIRWEAARFAGTEDRTSSSAAGLLELTDRRTRAVVETVGRRLAALPPRR